MSCPKRGTCINVSLRPLIRSTGLEPIHWEGSADAFSFRTGGSIDYCLGHLCMEALRLRLQPFHFHIDMESQ